MSIPILTFFNNKGGVDKTSLVYHLAWMFYDLGYRVLACDLDPQANLTSMFLHEEQLEVLWTVEGDRKTIYNALLPLYVVQQHSVRLDRPVLAYDKWVNRMPTEYSRNLLVDNTEPYAKTLEEDKKNSLATVKHYRSLVPMAQEAHKPIFHLKPVDGAIGSHASAAEAAYHDFKILAEKIA